MNLKRTVAWDETESDTHLEPKACLVCGPKTVKDPQQQADWCQECNFYYMLPSDLKEKIQHDDAVVMSDFKAAIHGIRERNFNLIVKKLQDIRPLDTMMCLDVGCAYGHFLSVLKPLAKSVIGIEPNEQMLSEARANDISVIPGFFPDDLPSHVTYDLISFNDVLEHLPDPKAALEASYQRLTPGGGGVLLISIPSSDGVVFKFSGFLARLGIKTLNDRIWQRQFYTPHISYFDRRNLSKLATACGFTPLYTGSLPVVEGKSLYQRISVDTSLPRYRKVILYVCGTVYSALSRFMPEEYFYTVFRKST